MPDATGAGGRTTAELIACKPCVLRIWYPGHQLKDAEDRLGARLFLRQGRRLVPTAAGERLVRAAEEVLAELGAAEDEIRGLGRGQEGLIRVSTECYPTYHWLPAALKDLEQRFPAVAVEIVVEATRRPLVSPARVVRVELTEAILELARAGQGIAVLARWSVAPDLASGRLVGRRLGPRGLRTSWYAATLKRHAALPHLADFVGLVRRAATSAMAGRAVGGRRGAASG